MTQKTFSVDRFSIVNLEQSSATVNFFQRKKYWVFVHIFKISWNFMWFLFTFCCFVTLELLKTWTWEVWSEWEISPPNKLVTRKEAGILLISLEIVTRSIPCRTISSDPFSANLAPLISPTFYSRTSFSSSLWKINSNHSTGVSNGTVV